MFCIPGRNSAIPAYADVLTVLTLASRGTHCFKLQKQADFQYFFLQFISQLSFQTGLRGQIFFKMADELSWLSECYLNETLKRTILCMRQANERRHYSVTSSLIGWALTQNDLCLKTFMRQWTGPSLVQVRPCNVIYVCKLICCDFSAAMIKNMDDSVGKLVQGLKDNGLYEKSVFVFSADVSMSSFYEMVVQNSFYTESRPLKRKCLDETFATGCIWNCRKKGNFHGGNDHAPTAPHSKLQCGAVVNIFPIDCKKKSVYGLNPWEDVTHVFCFVLFFALTKP